ncbi:hypothetical protein EAF34_17450 [Escherichia coli]|nr:hypothetical protein [Escherichia coli]
MITMRINEVFTEGNILWTIFNDSATFLCCFFVNRLTHRQNPAILPVAVLGIYPTNCCLTGA